MSSATEVEVSCPACGQTQSVSIWQSLNVDLDANLRSRLFDGDINVFRCQSCDHLALMDVPLLYHDTTRRFCVQYLPEEAIEDEDAIRDYTLEGKLSANSFPETMAKTCSYLTEPHIVFDMQEMIRYICFREALYARLGTR